MKKLAICIPTYNRADVVKETIYRLCGRYRSRNWDMIFYDSSPNEDTKQVVASFEFDNLYYKHIDPSIHSNMKVYGIFEEYGQKDEYEYIWVCSDSIGWKTDVLEEVEAAIDEQQDLIVVNYRDCEQIGTRYYTDNLEMFRDCAWHMTLYGATILRTSTMLKNVNWTYLRERYGISERINHSHVAYYFEKLSTMENFSALHIHVKENGLEASPLKPSSGWRHETFHVWCTCWPSMINALPSCYDPYKDHVILQSGVNSLTLQIHNLVELREDKMYNLGIYREFSSVWKSVTTVPKSTLLWLALTPSKLAWLFDRKYYLDKWRVERRIRPFCKKYTNIYLYGCGIKSMRISSYVESLGIQITAYIVSDASNEKKLFRNIQVIQLHEDLLTNPDNGIILALNVKNNAEVVKTIEGMQVDRKCGLIETS